LLLEHGPLLVEDSELDSDLETLEEAVDVLGRVDILCVEDPELEQADVGLVLVLVDEPPCGLLEQGNEVGGV